METDAMVNTVALETCEVHSNVFKCLLNECTVLTVWFSDPTNLKWCEHYRDWMIAKG